MTYGQRVVVVIVVPGELKIRREATGICDWLEDHTSSLTSCRFLCPICVHTVHKQKNA